jgi:hypothetical protein
MIFPPLNKIDLAQPLNGDSPQARGLVHWWSPLFARGGSTLTDMVLRNEGAATGTPTRNASNEGDVGTTTDASNYWTCSDANMPSGGAEWTFAAWLRPGAMTTYGYFFGWGSNAGHQSISIGRIVSLGGTTPGWFVGDLAGVRESTSAPTTGELYHLVAVHTGSGTIEWQINGVDDAATGGSIAPNVVLGGTTGIGILPSYASDAAAMTFYDVRVYNRALSAAMRRSLYDPQTRGDLFRLRRKRAYIGATAAPAGGKVPLSLFIGSAA